MEMPSTVTTFLNALLLVLQAQLREVNARRKRKVKRRSQEVLKERTL